MKICLDTDGLVTGDTDRDGRRSRRGVHMLAEDKSLEKPLGAPFASPDALLDFIGQFHDPKGSEGRPPGKKAWVPPESEGL